MRTLMKLIRTIVVTLAIFATLAVPVFAQGESLTLSPTYQEDPVGGAATWTLRWSGFPTFIQDFLMHFGDGTSNNYRCWSNCGSGLTSWNHAFGATGDYTQYVSAESGTVFSNGASTHVY